MAVNHDKHSAVAAILNELVAFCIPAAFGFVVRRDPKPSHIALTVPDTIGIYIGVKARNAEIVFSGSIALQILGFGFACTEEREITPPIQRAVFNVHTLLSSIV